MNSNLRRFLQSAISKSSTVSKTREPQEGQLSLPTIRGGSSGQVQPVYVESHSAHRIITRLLSPISGSLSEVSISDSHLSYSDYRAWSVCFADAATERQEVAADA